jgi:hypothetical protein
MALSVMVAEPESRLAGGRVRAGRSHALTPRYLSLHRHRLRRPGRATRRSSKMRYGVTTSDDPVVPDVLRLSSVVPVVLSVTLA